MAIVLPLLVVGAIGVKALWLKRFIESNFNLDTTNAAFKDDIRWDLIRAYGDNAITVAEVLLSERPTITNRFDFETEVARLDVCMQQPEALPSGIPGLTTKDSRAIQYLEARMRHAVLGYALFLSLVAGRKPSEQLTALYLSLYLMGRLNMELPIASLEQVVGRLLKLHGQRRQPADRAVRLLLCKLSSAVAPELVKAIGILPFIQSTNIDPAYVLHTLTGYTSPKMTHAGIFKEMVESVSKSATSKKVA